MNSEASATRRYLALFLPWLAAERAMRQNVALRETTFALIGPVTGTIKIVATSPTAANLGLIGLTLGDARARLPLLATVEHDVQADHLLLDWVADCCERYSPTVTTDPPDAILIDITGCRGEFATEAALAEDACHRLKRKGLTSLWACATTPDAALALARSQSTLTIGELPVSALNVDRSILADLRRSGLRTINALAARPRAALAARFGPALTVQLARLLGEDDVRVVPRRHPPDIVVEQRCPEPMVATEAIMAVLDRLICTITTILAERARGGRRFEVSLFRCDGHVARLAVDTGRPTRDAAIVARLIVERIDTLADPLDPGFGYDLVRFAVPVSEPLEAVQLTLEDRSSGNVELALLVDRLTTRLGAHRVRRLVQGDSHLPEQAAHDQPFAVKPATPWRIAGNLPPRPLHLFAPPQPIEVMAEVPDAPPRWFRWRQLRHDVARAEGPERIAAEWWRRRDSRGTTRDYYRLEDSHGRRFWVFRHGLYGDEKANPAWYLHGLFA